VTDAWAARAGSAYAKAGEALQGASRAIEPATNAVRALGEITPGYRFTVEQLKRFVGMSKDEVEWLAEFTKTRELSVVLRSRAEESIAWVREHGAVLKPSWIKSKNVTWADVEFLGYSARDVGRVVMRKPPPFAELEARLAGKSISKGSPEYINAVERWQTREDTFAKEIKQMKEWDAQGEIKGKWPWQESGVDPKVQSDEIKDFKFRLGKDEFDGNAKVPEVFNHKTGKWASITGDIDLVSVTKADGSALSQEEYVKVLKELADSPLGIQHPDSTVWIKDGKFWFKQKEEYLISKGNVQFGPDGVPRSVSFNQALSDPEKWTKFLYRIVWDGGYGVGPGQVR
jgi:hypothetical protein